MSSTTFDYVVVGAGTAGCLLANRLSANPRNRVLLLEAGKKDNYPWIHIPVGYLYCIGNPRTDWLFNTESEPGLNGRSLRYPRGKTLGGCSSINGMIYMRGQARDYDNWIEKQRLRWDILDSFAEAAEQSGVRRVDDFNTGDNEGVGYFEVNQRSGWRWNSSKAFLRPASKRSNLTIWTEAQVEKLTFETDANGQLKCTGAVVNRKGARVTVTADKEVVLSAGAIGSPQILMLSGVGPAEELTSYGIPVVANVQGVGRNLQDHLQIRTVFKIEGAKTLNTLANSLIGKAMFGLEYAIKRSGPMSMSPSQLGAFTRSDTSRT
ncbi:MAG: FAD-binding protein, partial [Marivivens sp.]|nr:FAD-binding protein [Marivivens sp.]